LIRLHSLKVKSIRKLTRDSVVISFVIPEEEKHIFEYKQGQHISLQVEIKGERLRREYSICSSPHADEDLAIAVKATRSGTVSAYLCNELREGDVVDAYPPKGKFFTELNSGNSRTYLLIGGGSGIAPLFSILKSVLLVEPESNVVLYLGNDDKGSIMFFDELQQIARENTRFSLYLTLDHPEPDWTGLTGSINRQSLLEIIERADNKSDIECFVCGPQPMMEVSKQVLLECGIDQEHIHIEYFAPPVMHEEILPEIVEHTETKDKTIKVIIDDEEHLLTVPAGGVILDSAIEANLDPPFSCRSGICSTCRAKLLSGKVQMNEHEGLNDEEIREGYILTCQSHPLTDDVVVEYE
jgi:ring-1,2-phenylacetyl-CoA epoxidase subunit PaaE